MTRGAAILWAAGAALAGPQPGCRGSPGPDAGSERLAPAAAARAPDPVRPARPSEAADSAADGPRPFAARARCRAVTVDGAVRWRATTEAPLAPNDELAPAGWLVLGDGARVVVKDERTGRETTFLGPALARPCVGPREESWLLDGRGQSNPGSGESPGAEAWIATPHATLRYTAAAIALDVDARVTKATLAAGAAFVWLPDDARMEPRNGAPAAAPRADGGDPSREADDDADEAPWHRLGTGVTRIATSAGPGRTWAPGARAAVDRCAAAAQRAQALARELFDRDAALATAGVAAGQVRSRRVARAACALAHVRVEGLAGAAFGGGGAAFGGGGDAFGGGGAASEGVERPAAGLLERLDEADATWSKVPLP